MKETFTRRDFWDHAGKAGLVLGAISILYMVIEQLWLENAAEAIGNLPASLAAFVLWAAKFAGCILLMRWFMQRFVSKYDAVSQRDASRYGTAIALLSALIYSAFVLAWSKFIDPEMYARAFETVMTQYSAMMDANSIEMVEQLQDRMPTIAFFSNFIWCFLFGTVLSSILSHKVGAADDPFDPKNPFTQDNA